MSPLSAKSIRKLNGQHSVLIMRLSGKEKKSIRAMFRLSSCKLLPTLDNSPRSQLVTAFHIRLSGSISTSTAVSGISFRSR
jgi:hypothetical protein